MISQARIEAIVTGGSTDQEKYDLARMVLKLQDAVKAWRGAYFERGMNQWRDRALDLADQRRKQAREAQ